MLIILTSLFSVSLFCVILYGSYKEGVDAGYNLRAYEDCTLPYEEEEEEDYTLITEEEAAYVSY